MHSITHKGSVPDKGGTVVIETASERGASLGTCLPGPVRARVARPSQLAGSSLGLQFVLRPGAALQPPPGGFSRTVSSLELSMLVRVPGLLERKAGLPPNSLSVA